MEKSELRILLHKEEQERFFKKFTNSFSSDGESAEFLNISKYNLFDYKNCRTRYVPLEVLEKIADFLSIHIPEIIDRKTLKEIRKLMAYRATSALKSKYGSSFKKILQEGSKRALKEKYGPDAYKIITSKGHESSRQKYGENWRAILSKKGVEGLRRKYGGRGFEIILRKGRKTLEKKYGSDWQKRLSDIGKEAVKKKYIVDFNKRPQTHKNVLGKRQNTPTELFLMSCLIENHIAFEHNIVKGDIEFDVVIPDRNNPRYIIEISDAKPTTYNQRKKLLQLYYQKKMFPQAQLIAILKTYSYNGKSSFFLQDIIKSFLEEENIILFSLENIKAHLSSLIHSLIKGEMVRNDEKFLSSKNIFASKGGSIIQSKKTNNDEALLHNFLLEIKAKPLGAFPIELKNQSFICFDNFEFYKDGKIAYEINSSKSYNSLRSLGGKILLCKRYRPEIKVIVILTNPNLSNNSSFTYLNDIADKVVLRRNFNKEGLLDARDDIFLQP